MSRKKRGNCYITCEALYHLLGGKKANLVPYRLKHKGDTHWYLVNREVAYYRGKPYYKTFRVIDPTAKQFKKNERPDYFKGVGSGFLTKKPSKRARALMRQMLWQKV